MYTHAALITLLTVVLHVVAVSMVGRARGRHGIQVPAVTGNVDFERVFRAHQNTIEATVMFLPTLWVATMACNPRYVAWLGFAWLAGRAWYLFAYAAPAGNRSPGFMIGALSNIALLVWALWCVVGRMLV
jgi:uncharacterized MAPEG superfamily protein